MNRGEQVNFEIERDRLFYLYEGRNVLNRRLPLEEVVVRVVVRVVTGPLKGCRRRYCLKAIVRVRTIVLLFLGLGLRLKC